MPNTYNTCIETFATKKGVALTTTTAATSGYCAHLTAAGSGTAAALPWLAAATAGIFAAINCGLFCARHCSESNNRTITVTPSSLDVPLLQGGNESPVISAAPTATNTKM